MPLVMVAWNRRSVATPIGVKRSGCGAGRAPVDKRPCHPRNWHSMVRELARRRISAAEWLGFGLLAAALLQSRYRRQSAAISVRTSRARSNLRMNLDPPGATAAFVAQTLLNARRRS